MVSAADKDKVERIVLLPNFTYAPFPQGTQLGKISYQLNGEEIELGSVGYNGSGRATNSGAGDISKNRRFL